MVVSLYKCIHSVSKRQTQRIVEVERRGNGSEIKRMQENNRDIFYSFFIDVYVISCHLNKWNR